MIAVETPVGKFNVWTKRFGNNPKIKVLLVSYGFCFTVGIVRVLLYSFWRVFFNR